MTLDQLMAFTVSGDHERQDQVWDRLQSAYNKDPHVIRRMLTEGAVRASDKQAVFIGVDGYEEAGGTVLRDLSQGDNGGWLRDVLLVERLVAERLEREAAMVRAEGWRWIEVARDFRYGYSFGLRQLRGETAAHSGDHDRPEFAVDQLAAALRQAPAASLGQKADWVVMVVWLVQLRARLLLPADAPAHQQATAKADQLRGQLVTLADSQALAGWLQRRPQLGHDVFARGRPEVFGVSVDAGPAIDVIDFLWASLAQFDDEPATPDGEAVYRSARLALCSVAAWPRPATASCGGSRTARAARRSGSVCRSNIYRRPPPRPKSNPC